MAIGLFHHDVGGASPLRGTLHAALRRLAALVHSVPDDALPARLRRLGEVCEILDGARAILVDDGWVQNRWYGDQPAPATGPRACLVGAVVRAARGHDETGAGPAIDVLWDALQESRGLAGPGVAGRAAPPQVRIARVRDLTRWNDRAGRTRDDVVGLLDLATSRTIMTAMRTPEPVGR
jgi:hypothetical protein